MRPVMGRGADQDSVVVLRKTLDLHQRLPSAVRAGAEVRMRNLPTVERADDLFGARRLKVFGPPAEVGDLLGMPGREVGGPAGMSGIRRAAGVAASQRVGDAAVVDRAG